MMEQEDRAAEEAEESKNFSIRKVFIIAFNSSSNIKSIGKLHHIK